MHFPPKAYKKKSLHEEMTQGRGWTRREALNRALADAMGEDRLVVVLGEEVGAAGGGAGVTAGLAARFGRLRVVDMPISELGFTGLAVGAALAGLRPVVEYMSMSFALQALDQIVNMAAKAAYMSGGRLRCPVVFRGPSGCNFGFAAQHTQEFHALFGAIPGLVVLAPYRAADHYHLLRTALRLPCPVVLLENEMLYGKPDEEDSSNEKNQSEPSLPSLPEELADAHLRELFKARVAHTGTSITVVAVGYSMAVVEEAIQETSASVELIDLRAIRPLDTATVISSVEKTQRLLVVEHGWKTFGVGSEIVAQVALHCSANACRPPRMAILAAAETPTPFAARLERQCYPQPADILREIQRLCDDCSAHTALE